MEFGSPRVRLKHLPGCAGVDEAGRGPLAGPVVAAAVILPKGFRIAGIQDSKQLTRAQREEMEERIKRKAVWAVAAAPPSEIDRLNILWATMQAMQRALEALPHAPERIFIDGNRCPSGLSIPAEAVIKGDARLACVAAASILAKTERDRILTRLGAEYPEYGFEKHFGYPTPEHLEALRRYGPCPHHRRSFAPVRENEQPCLIFAE